MTGTGVINTQRKLLTRRVKRFCYSSGLHATLPPALCDTVVRAPGAGHCHPHSCLVLRRRRYLSKEHGCEILGKVRLLREILPTLQQTGHTECGEGRKVGDVTSV